MSFQRLFASRAYAGWVASKCTNIFGGQQFQPSRCFNIFRTKPVIKAKINFNHSNNVVVKVDKRCLRTSTPRGAIPPAIILFLSRFAKFGGMLIGRAVRRWWQKLPAEEKAGYSKKMRKNRYVISGMLGALAFGSFVYYDSHVQETPFTKRRRFLAFTDKQFEEMSKFELETLFVLYKGQIIPASMKLLSYRRVVSVAQRLIKANTDLSQIHEKEWTITVVDDDNQCNAFVLPCGSVFVFSGLLKLCETDDELGVILGHEMAHAVMGHGAEKASFMHFLDMLMVIPLAAVWAILPTDATAAICHWITSTVTKVVMELPHSRFIEHEADEIGLILTAKACFDIRQAPVLWDKMAITQGEMPIDWLSTHPSHDKRQSQLFDLLPAALHVRDQCKCPKLPFYDPKQKLLEYSNQMKLKKSIHEGLMIPVKV